MAYVNEIYPMNCRILNDYQFKIRETNQTNTILDVHIIHLYKADEFLVINKPK